MSRGTGKAAQQAAASNKLSEFVKPAGKTEGLGTEHEYVDWAEVDPLLVGNAVWAVNKQDGSLLLGHSRDKKSYSVRVYLGNDANSYYFPCNPTGVEQLSEFLEALIRTADLDL